MILHCPLFVMNDLLTEEHNNIVYGVSKQQNIRVHTQSVTVTNQDTLQHFLSGSTSKPLSHTRLHLTDGLGWLKVLSFCETPIQLYTHFLSPIYISEFDGGKRVRFTYVYRTVHRLDSWIDRPTWCHLFYYFTIYCSTCFEC